MLFTAVRVSHSSDHEPRGDVVTSAGVQVVGLHADSALWVKERRDSRQRHGTAVGRGEHRVREHREGVRGASIRFVREDDEGEPQFRLDDAVAGVALAPSIRSSTRPRSWAAALE